MPRVARDPGAVILTNDELAAAGVQLYELIGASSGLLTDYSSVWIDYLSLDRPIGFVVPDELGYAAGRGFTPPDALDSVCPGVRLVDIDEIRVFAEDVRSGRRRLVVHVPGKEGRVRAHRARRRGANLTPFLLIAWPVSSTPWRSGGCLPTRWALAPAAGVLTSGTRARRDTRERLVAAARPAVRVRGRGPGTGRRHRVRGRPRNASALTYHFRSRGGVSARDPRPPQRPDRCRARPLPRCARARATTRDLVATLLRPYSTQLDSMEGRQYLRIVDQLGAEVADRDFDVAIGRRREPPAGVPAVVGTSGPSDRASAASGSSPPSSS